MKRIKKALVILMTGILFFSLLPISGSASPIKDFFKEILSGNEAWHIQAGVQFQKISIYDEKRTEKLNTLLKHFAFVFDKNKSVYQIGLITDNREPVLGCFDTEKKQLLLSWQDDQVYQLNENIHPESGTVFSARMIRWAGYTQNIGFLLTRGYAFFQAAPELFSEYARNQKIKKKLTNAGTAVLETTISIPADIVDSGFMAQTIDSAFPGMGTSLVFKGRQVFDLYFSEDHRLLRASYRGRVGLSDETMRNISLTWKCAREAGYEYDEVDLRSPSVQGRDRNNLALKRTQKDQDGKDMMHIEFSLDHVNGEERYQTAVTADLEYDMTMTGEVVIQEKEGKNEKKVVFNPEIAMNGKQYSGKLEFIEYSGKIVKTDCMITLSFSPGSECPESLISGKTVIAVNRGDDFKDQITQSLAKTLLREIITIPYRDLSFISDGFSEDEWNRMIRPEQ